MNNSVPKELCDATVVVQYTSVIVIQQNKKTSTVSTEYWVHDTGPVHVQHNRYSYIHTYIHTHIHHVMFTTESSSSLLHSLCGDDVLV